MKVLILVAMLVCAASAKSMKLGAFSYKSCNPTASIQITDLTVVPDPILLPGTVTISLTGVNADAITTPTAISITLEKDVGGNWEAIPCVDGTVGSCDFDDVCADLAEKYPDGEGCPQPTIDSGLGCSCPIDAGTYTLSNLEVDITVTPPPQITNGDYHLGVSASHNGVEIACVDVYATLQVNA